MYGFLSFSPFYGFPQYFPFLNSILPREFFLQELYEFIADGPGGGFCPYAYGHGILGLRQGDDVHFPEVFFGKGGADEVLGAEEGAHAFSGEAEEGFHVVGHAADEGCEGRFGEVECLEVAGDVFAPGIQEGAFGEGTHAFFDVPLESGGDFLDGAFYGFVEEFLCDEEADLFFVDRFYFNAWRDFPVVPDGEVDIAFDEAGPELFIRGFQNAECDARVLVPEFLQDGRKKGPAADIADADTQFSCFFFCDVEEGAAHGFLFACEREGVMEEGPSSIRKLEGDMADDKLAVQLALQRGDAGRERLLGNMEFLSCACEILLPRKHDEIMQRLKVHSNFFPWFIFFIITKIPCKIYEFKQLDIVT